MKNAYKVPWTLSDNPGGWVEVTDACNLNCPGCFRHKLAGHYKKEDIMKEVDFCIHTFNCDRISIAGGEPLIYPNILEIISYIHGKGVKPVLFSNGIPLDKKYIVELEQAGLHEILIHIDSKQNRPGWEGRSELELNELRQYYTDLVYENSKLQCGFNVTVYRDTLSSISDVAKWYLKNSGKTIHLAFIAIRGVPYYEDCIYSVNGNEIEADKIPYLEKDLSSISISTEDILQVLSENNIPFLPASYLNGTKDKSTYKFLFSYTIANKREIFGHVGSKAAEFYQGMYHLLNKRYPGTIPDYGKAIFLQALVDRETRKALFKFIRKSITHPKNLFLPISLQLLLIQQPYEFGDYEINLCDGCINMMYYKGEAINSCRLDEYRMYGGPLKITPRQSLKNN